MALSKRLLTAVFVLPLLLASCADQGPADNNCEDGKCDGLFGWIDEGEHCTNFNKECIGELVCRPIDQWENDQFCLMPAENGDFCDDDDDCEGQSTCMGEGEATAGQCRGELAQDDRCTSFNFECSEGLTCQPVELFEGDQFCLIPGQAGDFCDDDDDCEGNSSCRQEEDVSAGQCSGELLASDRCTNFNFECSEGLTCRPVDLLEEEQFCQAPGTGGDFCDDDDDCEGSLVCVNEAGIIAGNCGSL